MVKSISAQVDRSSDGPPLCIGMTLVSFKTSGNTPVCRLIFIISRRDGNKTSEARLSIFGLIPSIPVDLLGFQLVRFDEWYIKINKLMNSFSTSALRSLKGRLSFISLSLTFAKCKFISSVIS